MAAWEASIGWDHPLVKRGIVPGHLLREAFAFERSGFSGWVSRHQHLSVPINRRPWFHLDRVAAWIADPVNSGDLPDAELQVVGTGQQVDDASPTADTVGKRANNRRV